MLVVIAVPLPELWRDRFVRFGAARRAPITLATMVKIEIWMSDSVRNSVGTCAGSTRPSIRDATIPMMTPMTDATSAWVITVFANRPVEVPSAECREEFALSSTMRAKNKATTNAATSNVV